MASHKYYYTMIGIALVTATTCTFLIFGYISFEQSYDRQHEFGENIYRINFDLYKDGGLESSNASSTPVVGPVLYNELSGVRDFARLYPRSGSMISYQNEESVLRIRSEDGIFHADSSFLRIFNFPMIQGDRGAVLKQPFKAVLSRQMASELFGSPQLAIGKVFQLSEEEQYEIEGVFEDLPENTHFQFEILLSMSTLEKLDWTREDFHTDWGWYSFYNYLLLEEGRSVAEIDEEIKQVTRKYTEEIDQRINGSLTYTLFPMTSIYLRSDLHGEMDRKGNAMVVQLMLFVASLIIMLAMINYLGLISSVSLMRSKETGIRKVLGSRSRVLWLSFAGESAVHLTLAITFSGLFTFMLWDPFSSFIGKEIPFSILFSWSSFLMISLGVAVISGFTGFYVFSILKTSHLSESLKGRKSGSRSIELIRKSILFFQYFACISLLIVLFAMYDHLSFMVEKDPGFSTKEVMSIKLRRTRGDDHYFRKIVTFSQALRGLAGVKDAGLSSNVPSEEIGWTNGGKIVGQLTTVKFEHLAINERYIPLYGISMTEGQNFSDDKNMNERSVLINESAMYVLGYTDPKEIVNKTFLHGGGEDHPFKIIGVVQDFYQRGVKYKIGPTIFHYLPDHAIYTGSSYLSFKIAQGVSLQTLSLSIENEWQQHFPGQEMEFSEMTRKYLTQYKSDQKAAQLLLGFTILAITIACIGLIGLVSFTTKRRIREIGIRKVMGASRSQVQLLLGKPFFVVIVVAVFTAWPLAYFFIDSWMSNYELRSEIDLSRFLLAAIIVLLVSIPLIAFQSYSASNKNPAETIRVE